MESPYATAPLNLDPSTPQFRLLELHPRTSSSTISCTLSSYSFDGRHPAYKALSYTWGPKAKPHLILLNGIEFHVGHNLWTFLDQMCLQGQYGVYWVDAICIDQDNTLEKNHQVQMMRRIYSTAENVVVWLGEANHDEMSDTAMDLLAGSRSWAEIGIPCPPDYFFDPKIKSEIMVAKRISIYCGSKSLEWQTLTDFMNFLFTELVESWEEDEVRAYCVYSTRAKQLVYDKWQARTIQKRWTLAELLNDYRFWEASNILDKVYALCGLASDADNVVIDYDLSPKDVVVHFLDKDPRDWDRLAWRAYLALGHASKEGFEELLNSMESPRDHIVRK